MGVWLKASLLFAILLGAGSCSRADTAADPPVKKSNSKICHERGTADYAKTVHFSSFKTLDACLKSGGRLPKNLGSKKRHFDPDKPAQPGDEGVLFGPMVRVIDGDTFVVRIQGAELPVRLNGIDAPEPKQPFGDKAREALTELIGDQPCVMVYDEGDVYGRLIVHLWIGETYVNAEMLKRGMAWFDSASAPDNYLVAEENAARDEKRGLWALPMEERMPPWEWRKESR